MGEQLQEEVGGHRAVVKTELDLLRGWPGAMLLGRSNL